MSRPLISQVLLSPDMPTGIAPQMDSLDIFNALSEGVKDEAEIIEIDPNATEEDKEEIKIETKENEVEEIKDEELDELSEIEKELEGPTEEQLELIAAPRRKEILKEFPELFKKFPYLEKAYYRDQQFTELFGTPTDAKEVVEQAKQYTELNSKIESGDIETVLSTILKKDKNTFHNVVDNYLPALHKVDPTAYLHIVGNVTKHIAIEMVKEAKRTSNEALQNAAALMHQYAFGTSEFTPPQNLGSPKTETDERETEFVKREREFNQRRYEEAQNDLSSKVNNSIKATIDKFIDPKNSMTEYVKRAATKDALEKVNEFISKDSRFRNLMDNLWQDAFKRNFDKAAVDKIRMACISKAQTLLPTVIKSARNEALKGLARKANNVEDKDDKQDDQKVRERSTPVRTTKIKDAKDIPANMTTAEFLMADD